MPPVLGKLLVDLEVDQPRVVHQGLAKAVEKAQRLFVGGPGLQGGKTAKADEQHFALVQQFLDDL